MRKLSMVTLVVALVGSWMNGTTARAQVKEEAIVRNSIAVFNEIMEIPAQAIPKSMLNDAYGVAIIPSVIKGSFVVGARYGTGVLLVRDQQGGWHAPVFITLTGGNIGWQVGVQATDVVLVFKTQQSVNGLLSGKFTIGADAAAAAGPVGRQASASTDGRLSAEIYSYSRSRGLFAGVSIDGSVIQVDSIDNATYYRPATPTGPVVVPASAQQLVARVTQVTGVLPTQPAPAETAAPTLNQPLLAQQHSKEEVEHLRDELARFAPELFELLDPSWQQYLALPSQVFQNNGHPSPEVMQQCLVRYDAVRSDPRYANLANRPEFQSTYGLLKHYIQAMSATEAKLNLPPPPVPQVSSR